MNEYFLALQTDDPSLLPRNLDDVMTRVHPNPFNYIESSPFDWAIERGAVLVFEELAKGDTVKHWRDEDGASALHNIFGKEGATAHHVNVLCQHIDPNVAEYPSLDKPIHYAAWYGNRNGMLEALLAQPNIDVNAQTIDEDTAGHALVTSLLSGVPQDPVSRVIGYDRAGVYRAIQAFGMLEKAGADFTIQNNSGHTPIDVLRSSTMARVPEIEAFTTRHDKQALLEGLGISWKPSDCKENTQSSNVEQPERQVRKRHM